MASKYLKNINENDFKFQELSRLLDATLKIINPEGLINGQNTIKIIEFLKNFENMDKFISPELYVCINDEIEKSKNKKNVREHVKKILLFPKVNYIPFTPVIVPEKYLEEINEIAKTITFKITYVEGKLYALCQTNKKINDITYDLLYDVINLQNLEKNPESCHVTLVNSNIVAEIGENKVLEFIDKYNECFNITTGNINCNISEDWSPFKEVYVISIRSEYIENFFMKFNVLFNKNIFMSTHITFAMLKRDLFKNILN